MKNRSLVIIAAALGLGTLAHAQHSEWEQREAQRRWRVEQQRIFERQQWEWQQRRLGAGAYTPPPQFRGLETIDRRTQSLPAAPPGYEWEQTTGGFALTYNSVPVMIVRDVTPAPAQ